MTEYVPPFFIVICVTMATFLIYLTGSNYALINPAKNSSTDSKRAVLLNRLFGFICYGGIPLATILFLLTEPQPISTFGLKPAFQAVSFYWLILLVPLMIFIAYLGNRTPDETELYPMIRIKEWTFGLILLNSASWIIYLIGYEFFFRGFLLHGSLMIMDSWSAVALNAVVYALMHLHKNMRETIGSIPFGAVLAIISLHTGSIWTGVIIHSVLAISNSLWAVKLQPDFDFDI